MLTDVVRVSQCGNSFLVDRFESMRFTMGEYSDFTAIDRTDVGKGVWPVCVRAAAILLHHPTRDLMFLVGKLVHGYSLCGVAARS